MPGHTAPELEDAREEGLDEATLARMAQEERLRSLVGEDDVVPGVPEMVKAAKKKRKRKKKKKSAATASDGGGASQMELDPPDDVLPSRDFANLERREREIEQIWAAATACVENRNLEEALDRHYAVIRAADEVLAAHQAAADADGNVPEQQAPAGQGNGEGETSTTTSLSPAPPQPQPSSPAPHFEFTVLEERVKVPGLLEALRTRRRLSMGEAVNLLAHAERYDHVPQLCTQLLDVVEIEQEKVRWLFHRGRAFVKQWEQHHQQINRQGVSLLPACVRLSSCLSVWRQGCVRASVAHRPKRAAQIGPADRAVPPVTYVPTSMRVCTRADYGQHRDRRA
jgi:hypothetical protein